MTTPAKKPLTNRVISISVRDRITVDGKPIRQKRFIRAARNPTTSPPTSTPANTTGPAPPPAEPPAPPPAPPPAAEPAPPAPPAAPAPPAFTPDQDAQLLDLKSKNTSWKQISIMMDGKPQYQLKDRFKELTTKPAEGGEPTAPASATAPAPAPEKTPEEKKKDEQGEKKKAAAEEKRKAGEERKKAWEEKKRQEKEEADTAAAAAAAAEKAGSGGGEAKAAAAAKEEKKIIFFDDGRFSLDEIVLVHKLAERYEERKWLEVASKFFDKTGKRVHADEMREALSWVGR